MTIVAAQETPGAPRRSAPNAIGVLSDGTMLAIRTDASGQMIGLQRPDMHVVAVAADGTIGSDLASAKGNEVHFQSSDGAIMLARPPFGRSTVTRVQGTKFLVAANDAWEIRVHGGDGGLQMLLRVLGPATSVTDEIVTRHVESRLADVPPGPGRERSEKLTRDLATHETLPAFGDVRFGEDGRIWVSDFLVDQREPTTWTIFASDGALAGRVTMPGDWRILRFGGDYVIAVVNDEFDRESVRRYAIPGARK
jgi:hypothetical protein